MTVLIIDDEIRLCRLIEHLIAWEDLGLVSLGSCNDGITGLKTIQEKNPDIVITDIRMPECSGLELIQKAQKINPKIHFLIISGYNDFSYAQTAIKYGVDDYLLKPIKEQDLKSALEKIIREYQKQILQEKEQESLRQKLDNNHTFMKNSLLEKLILLPDSVDLLMPLSSINEIYSCHFQHNFFQLIGMECFNHSNVKSGITTVPFIYNKIQTFIKAELTDLMNEIIFFSYDHYIYCLLNGPLGEFNTSRFIRKLRSNLHLYHDLLSDTSIFYYISEIADSHEKIRELPNQIQNLSYERYISSSDSIMEYRTELSQTPVRPLSGEEFLGNFKMYLEAFDFDKIQDLCQQLINNINSFPNLKGASIATLYMELIHQLTVTLKDLRIEHKNLIEDLQDNFKNSYDTSHLFLNTSNYILSFLSSYQMEKQYEISKPIRMAKEFIQQHYQENLTLELVGEEIGLNPSYLSSSFKKDAGCSFIEYITRLRITQAKQLLISSETPLEFIAESIGFHDLKYFSKKFKKSTGLSPRDYRKLYS